MFHFFSAMPGFERHGVEIEAQIEVQTEADIGVEIGVERSTEDDLFAVLLDR